MSTRTPAFQFYPKDFLTSERVIGMTYEQRGIYITLLCQCWLEGSLPSDLNVLAGYLRLRPAKLLAAWPTMKSSFTLRRGRLHHKRLDREWRKQLEHRKAKQQAGIEGAKRRWQSHASAIGLPMAKNSSSSSSPSSTPDLKSRKSSASRFLSGGEATHGQLVKVAHSVLDLVEREGITGFVESDSELRAQIKVEAAKLHLRFSTGDQIGRALDTARAQRRTATA